MPSKSSASTPNSFREQTTTGKKLAPPKIRIEPCRCIKCGGAAEMTCQQCQQETIYCKKCARRAKHEHPLKAFRRRDEELLNLRKNLTLSYHEHIVSCTSSICFETCHSSRYVRHHFKTCTDRPHQLSDIIQEGTVVFNGTSCFSCGLFITCMFLHAEKCKEQKCQVDWCNEIRDTFEMGVKGFPVFPMSEQMAKKCRDIHHVEWKKVENRKKELLVEDLLAISI